MNNSSPYLARLEEIHLSYRHDESWLKVLQGVSLDIAPGEVVGLVGESGCGKSTLARLLLGYRHPSSRIESGRAILEDVDLLGLERNSLDGIRGRRVALVPQDPTTALNPSMRVGAQIAEVLCEHGDEKSEEEITARIIELFENVGLPNPEFLVKRFPHQLSGGQQQRVTIAMALACNPSLVVLDEPTTALDVTTQDQILRLLVQLRSRLGIAMLYVTHDLGVVAQIADRVCVMYAGHVVETAATERIFSEPRHPYTRGLIGSVPRLDLDQDKTARPLRGLLRRSQLPKGCPFQPRCDFTEPSCAEVHQHPVEVASDHYVACQRWQHVEQEEQTRLKDVPESSPVTELDGDDPLVEFDDVSLSYSQPGRLDKLIGYSPLTVVHDLSFTIRRGEVVALVGESGSGKSTIAKAVSGLLPPCKGQIKFNGKPLPGQLDGRSEEQKRTIQYIFQNPDSSLNPRARVRGALGRPLAKFFAMKVSEITSKIAAALEEVRLPKTYAARFPDQLSGGERQRVAIARALVAKPSLLLCDEALSALDVSVQANILSMLEDFKKDREVAMLFISHDLAVVRSLADRVAVLFNGLMLEIGDTSAVYAPPYHPYTYALLQAVPDIERRNEMHENIIEQETSSGGRACPFAGRCQWKLGSQCETTPPPWRKVTGKHSIRCHRELDNLTALATD